MTIFTKIVTKIIKTKSVPGKIYGNSGIVYFVQINQTPSPYSMFQYIKRVATPKLGLQNCHILANDIDT